jgi:hypothetical protein
VPLRWDPCPCPRLPDSSACPTSPWVLSSHLRYFKSCCPGHRVVFQNVLLNYLEACWNTDFWLSESRILRPGSKAQGLCIKRSFQWFNSSFMFSFWNRTLTALLKHNWCTIPCIHFNVKAGRFWHMYHSWSQLRQWLLSIDPKISPWLLIHKGS